MEKAFPYLSCCKLYFNKMLKYSFLCVLLVFLLFQSCRERELGIELPYSGSQLFIYSELSPDKVVNLYLNQTYPPTGKFTVKQGLEGAEVNLLENGIFKEQLTYSDSGIYVSKIGLKPKVDSFYSFEVKLKGYPDANTQAVEIPHSVINPNVILSKNTIPSINMGTTGGVARKLDLVWEDEKGRVNNYLAVIEGEYQNQYLGINSYIIGKDSEMEDGCNFRRNRNHYLFRDICFSSHEFKESLALDLSGFIQNLPTSYTGSRLRNVDTYKVSISNVSQSYFRWLQDELQPEDIFLAFQLPKSRFSNVNNGYVVVIASNTTTFYLSAK